MFFDVNSWLLLSSIKFFFKVIIYCFYHSFQITQNQQYILLIHYWLNQEFLIHQSILLFFIITTALAKNKKQNKRFIKNVWYFKVLEFSIHFTLNIIDFFHYKYFSILINQNILYANIFSIYLLVRYLLIWSNKK